MENVDIAGGGTAARSGRAGKNTRRAERAARASRAEVMTFLSGTARVAHEPFPLVIHRGARLAIRGHLQRELRRVGILAAADIAVMLLLQGLLRATRDAALFGDSMASLARAFVPPDASSGPGLIALLLCLTIFGNYRAGEYRRNPQSLFAGVSLGLGLVWWHRLWTAFSLWSVVGFALALGVLGLSLVCERLLIEALVRYVRPVNPDAARALAVGAAPVVRHAVESGMLDDPAERIVVGSLELPTDRTMKSKDCHAQLVRAVDVGRIDTIVLVGSIEEPLFEEILAFADAACCQVLALPNECLNREVDPKLRWHRSWPMLELTRPGLRGHQLVLKRCLDLLAAALALVLLAPLMAAVALVVRLTSAGPVIFRQMRVGAGGRLFMMYKFRTMIAGAEAQQEQLQAQSVYADDCLFKIPDDPRVTRLGRFLRRSSLDELPQFWNVLRGEMSLVGPRPPTPSEVAHYAEHHYQRFAMKPGITGPWQVSGRNSITDFEQVVRLETAYLRNWSLWKDFGIIVRTVPAVVRMDGAH